MIFLHTYFPTAGSCPYELSGVDDSIFWIRDYKGDLVVAGHCRTGALFDTGVCDCLGGSGITSLCSQSIVRVIHISGKHAILTARGSNYLR